MNVHASGDDGVGLLGSHHLQHGLNNLVAAHPEDSCAKNMLGLRINRDFHEARRLAHFTRAAYLGHH